MVEDKSVFFASSNIVFQHWIRNFFWISVFFGSIWFANDLQMFEMDWLARQFNLGLIIPFSVLVTIVEIWIKHAEEEEAKLAEIEAEEE